MRPAHKAELADALTDSLGNAHGLVKGAVLEQQSEFIATQARQHIARAHAGLQQQGHLLQQTVACRVAAGIVHDLELVEVHVDQCVLASRRSARSFQQKMQLRLEFTAIDEPRERVVGGLIRQRAAQATLTTDIAEHHHRTSHFAVTIADGAGRTLHAERLPVTAAQSHVIMSSPRSAIFERQTQRRWQGFTGGFVDQREHLHQRHAYRLGRNPARQLLGRRVQVINLAQRVRTDDGIANGLQRHLRAVLFIQHRQFGQTAAGNVVQCSLKTAHSPIAIAHQAHILGDSQATAIEGPQFEFMVTHFAFQQEALVQFFAGQRLQREFAEAAPFQ